MKQIKIFLLFLLNAILIGGLSAGIVLDQHYKKVKDKTIKPLISTLDEVSRDAPLLAGIRNLSKYMESAVKATTNFFSQASSDMM